MKLFKCIIILLFCIGLSGCSAYPTQGNKGELTTDAGIVDEQQKDISNETPSTANDQQKGLIIDTKTNQVIFPKNIQSLKIGNSQQNLVIGSYSVATDGEYDYFTNGQCNTLYKADRSFSNIKVLISEDVRSVNVMGNRIYYISQKNYDSAQICSINKDGGDKKVIYDGNPAYLSVVENVMFFTEDSNICAMYIDGTSKINIVESKEWISCLSYNLGYLYYTEFEMEHDGDLYRINLMSKNIVELIRYSIIPSYMISDEHLLTGEWYYDETQKMSYSYILRFSLDNLEEAQKLTNYKYDINPTDASMESLDFRIYKDKLYCVLGNIILPIEKQKLDKVDVLDLEGNKVGEIKGENLQYLLGCAENRLYIGGSYKKDGKDIIKVTIVDMDTNKVIHVLEDPGDI